MGPALPEAGSRGSERIWERFLCEWAFFVVWSLLWGDWLAVCTSGFLQGLTLSYERLNLLIMSGWCLIEAVFVFRHSNGGLQQVNREGLSTRPSAQAGCAGPWGNQLIIDEFSFFVATIRLWARSDIYTTDKAAILAAILADKVAILSKHSVKWYKCGSYWNDLVSTLILSLWARRGKMLVYGLTTF